MITDTFTVTLVRFTCGKCGGTYAISQEFQNESRRLGNHKQDWSCPYCKALWGYGESETDRLNAQIKGLKDNETWLRDRAERARLEANRLRNSRNAVKGVLTRVKNRIKHGVCPCCNRTFQNLARHMDTQHPDFAPAAET